MEIARSLGGYTLGAADILRRAMGKKKPEEMAKQREIFTKGAQERGIESNKSEAIFDLMEKFAGYGFNKSHSAAYALIAYQTAWLKTKFPAPFMAAVLSADMDNTDKIVTLIRECNSLGLKVEGPDINESEYRFKAKDLVTVKYGLGAIKGLGFNIISALIKQRKQKKYSSVIDLCKRNSEPKLSRRVLEVIIKSGSADSLHRERALALSSIEYTLQVSEQSRSSEEIGQGDLFGIEADSEDSGTNEVVINAENLPSYDEVLFAEKETLGFYLSGHPIEKYIKEVDAVATCSLGSLRPGKTLVGGLIQGIRIQDTRRGKMAIVILEDKTNVVDVYFSPKVYEEKLSILIPDYIVFIEGKCVVDRFSGKLTIQADKVYSLDEVRKEYAIKLFLEPSKSQLDEVFIESLKATLEKHRPGNTKIVIKYHHGEADANFGLGEDWKISIESDLLNSLKSLLPEDRIQIQYAMKQ